MHVELLKQGAENWNEWRRLNPNIQWPDLSQIDLSKFDFRKINLGGVNFRGTNLNGANLSRVNIPEADLSEANLSEADLSRADFLRAKLSNANLINVGSDGANFRRANLNGADLRGAYLGNTNFSGSSLKKAYLNRANFGHSNLTYSDLSEADLSDAQLSEANISSANLEGADFSRVLLRKTVFSDNDLRFVKGLDTIIHYGPSIIDVNSVKFPHGEVLKSFLRGTGFSDTFIEYLPSLQQNTCQFYSVFISYSSKDIIFAQHIHSDLQNRGVRCWFASEDMKIGDKLRKRIDEAIHIHEKLLLLLSEHSIKSNWIEDEVEAALEKEQRQQREVLFPIRLDNAIIKTNHAWASKLRRQRHIGDFTHWTNPQAYEKAFEGLLRDLKKAEPTSINQERTDTGNHLP